MNSDETHSGGSHPARTSSTAALQKLLARDTTKSSADATPAPANKLPRDTHRSPAFHRIVIDGDEGDADFVKCATIIAEAIHARHAYKSIDRGQLERGLSPEELAQLSLVSQESPAAAAAETPRANMSLSATNNSVVGSDTAAGAMSSQQQQQQSSPHALHTTANKPQLHFLNGIYRFDGMQATVPSWKQYVKDVRAVYGALENGPCLSTARTRLTSVSEKFQLYALLNNALESDEVEGGVYAPCTRVDNAVHMKTAVPAELFVERVTQTALRQPRLALLTDPDTGAVVTLEDYLRAGGVEDPRTLTVQSLGLHPMLYQQRLLPFDLLDELLGPARTFGARLLQIAMDTTGDGHRESLGGPMLRTVLETQEFREQPVTATEMSLDLYGESPHELAQLAAWVGGEGLNEFSRNMWTLTITHRRVHHATDTGALAASSVSSKTIGDQLRHIFYPMLMATYYPRDPAWAPIAQLLKRTGAISIRTEAVPRTRDLLNHEVDPSGVRRHESPGDYYMYYYVWANLVTLNALRVRMGLRALHFAPTVHEHAPAFDQLVASYLLGDVVYDVTSLQKSWIMQYLYVYCRIGIVLSPLRDNALRVPYMEHPVVQYFRQGLCVSIATANPLYFHHRVDQPLLEEYATLMKLRSLTPMDMCELARNSVLNSNFSDDLKQQWLGANFMSPSSGGGDAVARTGVCADRLQFRHEAMVHEGVLLSRMLAKATEGSATAAPHVTAPVLVDTALSPIRGTRSSPLPRLDSMARLINYTDRRIVYPRADIYGSCTQQPVPEEVKTLRAVLILRKKYANIRAVDVRVEDVFARPNGFDESSWEYNNYYGVYLLSSVGKSPAWPSFIPPVREFMVDVAAVREAVGATSLRRLAVHRLRLLERKFRLHLSMNLANEAGERKEKAWNNRDFFTARKVDTNVHTDVGLNARTLLEFFVDKARHHDSDVVFEEDQRPITLRQLLARYEINVNQITVDELHYQLRIHRDLHAIFLSTDNFMQGRYFAELTKQTLALYKEDAYHFAESRLKLYGSSPHEWVELAHWFDRYGMASSQCRWMVCFPRSYRRLRLSGKVKNFGAYLEHLFEPLWAISLHPAQDTRFHYFLTHVSGFDCVGDESKIDLPLSSVTPHEWSSDLNPPYNYYLYYLWANIVSLNAFRASRGLGCFTFRPQCGEQGGVEHLIGGFLLADGINHGVTLVHHPVMEYVYYLTQLGIAMSPLSNTSAASPYLDNPLPFFFLRGLHVSLATNEPLHFHFTREPLIEEYSIAAKLWQFEFNDLSEIARNSVLQSGFPSAWKAAALGPLYELRSTLGNDVRRSRLSDIRVAYRYEVYHTELNFLDQQLMGSVSMPRAYARLEDEVAVYESVMRRSSRDKRLPVLDGGTHAAPYVRDDVVGAPTDGTAAGDRTESLEDASAQARADIERLDGELRRLQAAAQQIAGENSAVASAVDAVRSRLREGGFALLGGLQSARDSAATGSAAEAPVS